MDLRQRTVARCTAVLRLHCDFSLALLLTTSTRRTASRPCGPKPPLTRYHCDRLLYRREVTTGNLFRVAVAPSTVTLSVRSNSPRTTLYTVLRARAVAPIRPNIKDTCLIHGARVSVARLELFVCAYCWHATVSCFLDEFPAFPLNAATAANSALTEWSPITPFSINTKRSTA